MLRKICFSSFSSEPTITEATSNLSTVFGLARKQEYNLSLPYHKQTHTSTLHRLGGGRQYPSGLRRFRLNESPTLIHHSMIVRASSLTFSWSPTTNGWKRVCSARDVPYNRTLYAIVVRKNKQWCDILITDSISYYLFVCR